MFSWLHSTAIKKWASHLFETNSARPIDFKLSEVIQPIVEIQPYIDVMRTSVTTGTNVVYTTPTDKEFYLTNVAMSGYSEAGVAQGEATIEFTTEDGQSRSMNISTDNTASAGSLALSVQFPMRGVLLKKGSTITFTIDKAFIMFAGYTASDRA